MISILKEQSPYKKGERAFISSILNQAIIDGCSMKYPRPPSQRNYKKDKRLIIKQKSLLVSSFLFMNSIFNLRKNKKKKEAENYQIPYSVLDIMKYLKINKIGEIENLSWSGRNFFDSNNKIYSFYCDLLDICPKYLAKKAHIYFKKVDLGIYKKMKFVD